MSTDRFVNATDIAKLLRLSTQRVRQLAREGVFPPGVVVRLGRSLRFDLTAFESWCANGGAGFEGGWRRRASKDDD